MKSYKNDPGDVRRQHPISILFFIAASVKNLLYPMLAFLVSAIVRDDIRPIWVIGGIGLFLILIVTIGVLDWLRYTYRFEDGHLLVEHGLFVHKKLSVPRARIQSVDMSAGIVHRIFGVLRLQIETAGGTEPEVTLSAISRDEAAFLQAELHRAPEAEEAMDRGATDRHDPKQPSEGRPEQSQPAAADGYPTMMLPLRTILLYSATSGRVFLVLAALGAIYSQVDDWIQSSELWDSVSAAARFGIVQVVGLAVAVVLIAWVLGVLLTTAKEYGFTLMLQDGKLVTVRGLIERKQATVSLKRVQAVYMKQNAIRQLLGMVSVHIVTAGSIEKLSQSHLLCPLIKQSEVDALLAQFAPGYRLPERVERLSRRSLSSFVTLPLAIAVAAAIPGIVWIPDGYGFAALLLPAFAACWSWLRFKRTGWTMDGQLLAVHYGSFSRNLALVPRRRAQFYGVNVTPFQSRKKLATLQVSLASGPAAASFRIAHLPQAVASDMLLWLRQRN